MKRRWAIVIVLAVLVLAGLLVMFGDKIFGQKNGDQGAASGTTDTGTLAVAPIFPLKKGSRGEEVRKLQHYLNGCLQYYLVLTPLDEDGIFGAKTEGICVTVTGNREITEEFYNKHIK